MNIRHALRISALSLLPITAAMLLVAIWSMLDTHSPEPAAAKSLGVSALIAGAGLCFVTIFVRPTNLRFGRQEAFLMVGLTWFVAPIFAALPFLCWAWCFAPASIPSHPFQSPLNCYFEAVSGLTTTGSSILSDIESLPRGLLLWRSTTHWLGGLGIVLFFVAVLPMVGTTGKKLHFVESTGISKSGTHPRIRDTARVLWVSYTVITLLSIAALCIAGLPLFNAACETFGAIATGGFSVRNQSIAAYDSGIVDAILIVVMVLGAINFSLYVELARGRWRLVWRDPELRLMLALLAVGSAVVAVGVHGGTITTIAGRELEADWLTSIRFAVFNLVSMHTTTGFATADFGQWSPLALFVIAVGVFLGGSAGSTTGGIKVARLLAAGKIMLVQIQRTIQPGLVKPVRVGDRRLEQEAQVAVLVVVLLFALALLTGTTLLMLFGGDGSRTMDLTTAFTACLANLCTTGPGFGGVGPAQNYLWLPEASKLVLCALMMFGRLEIVTLLALLHRRFWSSP